MTSSNGNIFRVTGPLWGISPVIGEFPSQRPVTRSFYVFFDLHLDKRLSKQSWDWSFETPSGSLWRQCNEKNYQKKSSHLMRGIRPSVGQSETALLEILKSYWAHCHAKVRFSRFPYGICVFCKSRLGQDAHSQHETESLAACYWIGGCLLTGVSKKNRTKGIKRG